MRDVGLLLLSLFLLSACGYSAKSVVTLNSQAALTEVVLERLVTDLRKRRDGCFSERNASMQMVKTDEYVDYYITSNISALDVHVISRAGSNVLTLEFNEWMERRFTDYAAQCYQALVDRLIVEFGRERISIVESCNASHCGR